MSIKPKNPAPNALAARQPNRAALKAVPAAILQSKKDKLGLFPWGRVLFYPYFSACPTLQKTFSCSHAFFFRAKKIPADSLPERPDVCRKNSVIQDLVKRFIRTPWEQRRRKSGTQNLFYISTVPTQPSPSWLRPVIRTLQSRPQRFSSDATATGV